MWNVDPKKMCQQHLLGEHLEMHMFVGSIRRGIKMQGYIENGLLDTSLIKERHEQLANELLRRGMQHKSPLMEFKIPPQGHVDIQANEVELCKRCEECRKLINK